MAAQSWAIHHRRIALHRQLGKASLLVFPLFFAAFGLVLHHSSVLTAGGDPFRVVVAPGFAWVTLISIVVTGWLFHSALKHRRRVQFHARYMIAIPFLFAELVMDRVFNNHLPGLLVRSLEDAVLIFWAFTLANALAIALALFLYARDTRHGRAFIVVSIAMALQSVTYWWLGPLEGWQKAFLRIGELPATAVGFMGLVAGILITWSGWKSPEDRAPGRPDAPESHSAV